jgi:YafQ family addiction module toxin component
MYKLEIKTTADKIFRKLARKNRRQLEIISKQIKEIRKNPEHKYKHLRKPLDDFYRVHIDSNFVLIFDINHSEQLIVIYYYGHHDDVYKWRPPKITD